MPKPPELMPLNEADYQAIEAAVVETNRGRWFLAEYTKRNRNADTKVLLAALERIEHTIRSQRAAEPASSERPEAVDRIRFDLIEMAKAIARTKAEIATIKPDSDHHGKFGEATEELDSIVHATESATSDILAAAEQVQEVAWTLREQGLEPEVCDLLDARATDIYTACSFQDLTGQRTRKVIQAMRYLEDRINAMIDIWGLDSTMAAEADEVRRAHRGEPPRLNGPINAGHELDQADVDVVMGPADWPRDGASVHVEAPVMKPVPQLAPPPAQMHEPDLVPRPEAPPVRRSPLGEASTPALAPADVRKPSEAFQVSRPEPRPRVEAGATTPAKDPLAPLRALSAEEKIALFS
jgi:chemotaxis regulatin CheY-phosphate phosphatase CheZ